MDGSLGMSTDRTFKSWTPEEHARLVALRAAEKPWPDIATELGRSELACRTRYSNYQNGGGFRRTRSEVNEAIAAAREERGSARPRSLTAEFSGDPLPGRSALDQRQAEASSIRPISLAGGAR
jgi:hypothetical protein